MDTHAQLNGSDGNRNATPVLDARTLQSKPRTTDAVSIDDLVQTLEQAAAQLRAMQQAGVTLKLTEAADEEPPAEATDEESGFTKEQQDLWFHEGKCPHCSSGEASACWWTEVSIDMRYRHGLCEDCGGEWYEVHYRDAGPKFLVGPEELEQLVEENVAFWEGDGEDEEADEDEADAAAWEQEQKEYEAARQQERAEKLQKLEQLLQGLEIVVYHPLPATLLEDARRCFPGGFRGEPTERQLCAYVRHHLSNFEMLRDELRGQGLNRALYPLFRERADAVVMAAVAAWKQQRAA